MIALTWEDIDFQKKSLRINKTYSNKLGTGKHDILDPKTKNSIRNIDIDDKLFSMLMKHYEEESRIYHFSKKMCIFGNVKYLSPTTFARKLEKYILETRKEKEDFKRITPHGFRHSHVSLLIYLGCDSRDVAERIGDTVQMVESTYYHMFPDKKSVTVNAINQLKY